MTRHASSPIPVDENEVEITAIRAQGAGGQNVNKVSSAVHLRFDVRASSLPEGLKQRLLATADRRIGNDGCIVIKAQKHRSLERNRIDALQRLQALVDLAATPSQPRIPTRPSAGAQRRRLERKKRHSQLKAARNRVED